MTANRRNFAGRTTLGSPFCWATVAAMVMLTPAVMQAQVSPPVTANLLIGLDGSDVITAGSAVNAWSDQAAFGGSQDFVSGVDPQLISEAMPNGTIHNVVDFNGSSTFLELGSDASMDGNTISWFLVVHSDDIASTDVFFRNSYSSGAGSPAGNQTLWGSFTAGATSKYVSHARNSANGFTADGPVGVNGEWVIVEAVWNGSGVTVNGNGAEEIFVGAFDATGSQTFGTTYPGIDSNPSGHILSRLGKDSDGSGRHFDGGIAEVLVYNTALDVADRVAVEDYLINKYFLLPACTECSDFIQPILDAICDLNALSYAELHAQILQLIADTVVDPICSGTEAACEAFIQGEILSTVACEALQAIYGGE